MSIYQTHILKTEVWCDNIGKWATRVGSARLVSSKDPFLSENYSNDATLTKSHDENILLFEIYVELLDETKNIEIEDIINNEFQEGWIIYRSLNQFEDLNEKLFDLIPVHIKKLLKKLRKINLLAKNFTDEKFKNATAILNEYLKVCFMH